MSTRDRRQMRRSRLGIGGGSFFVPQDMVNQGERLDIQARDRLANRGGGGWQLGVGVGPNYSGDVPTQADWSRGVRLVTGARDGLANRGGGGWQLGACNPFVEACTSTGEPVSYENESTAEGILTALGPLFTAMGQVGVAAFGQQPGAAEEIGTAQAQTAATLAGGGLSPQTEQALQMALTQLAQAQQATPDPALVEWARRQAAGDYAPVVDEVVRDVAPPGPFGLDRNTFLLAGVGGAAALGIILAVTLSRR